MGQLDKVVVSAVAVCGIALAAFGLKSYVGSRAAKSRLDAISQIPKINKNLEDFLHSQEIANPDQALKSAQVMAKVGGPIAKLSGDFAGVLRPVDPNGKSTGLVTAIKTGQTKRGVVSMMSGRLLNQKAIRTFAFSSSIRLDKGDGRRQAAALLQVSPGDYLQMFYVPAMDRWVGNYYSKGGTGKFQFIGTAELARI